MAQLGGLACWAGTDDEVLVTRTGTVEVVVVGVSLAAVVVVVGTVVVVEVVGRGSVVVVVVELDVDDDEGTDDLLGAVVVATVLVVVRGSVVGTETGTGGGTDTGVLSTVVVVGGLVEVVGAGVLVVNRLGAVACGSLVPMAVLPAMGGVVDVVDCSGFVVTVTMAVGAVASAARNCRFCDSIAATSFCNLFKAAT